MQDSQRRFFPWFWINILESMSPCSYFQDAWFCKSIIRDRLHACAISICTQNPCCCLLAARWLCSTCAQIKISCDTVKAEDSRALLCSIELVEGIYGKVSLTKGLLLVCLTVVVIDAHVFQYRYNRRLPSYAALCKALFRSCSKTLCSPLPCTTSVTTAAMHTAVEQTLSRPLRWNSHRPWGRKQRWFRARSYHRFRRTT
jgi:hypothetical protein